MVLCLALFQGLNDCSYLQSLFLTNLWGLLGWFYIQTIGSNVSIEAFFLLKPKMFPTGLKVV